jgi:DMSO/TMAO reductase YedYZ heme-binding membrane subunit
MSESAAPGRPRGIIPGRRLAWGLVAVFALALAANWVYPDDHLIQQRVSEVQGHLALVCLGLTLAARPLERRIPGLLRERRTLGLLAFAFSVMHTWSTIVHVLGGSLDGMFFLPLDMQLGVMLGVVALMVMVPLALTSNDLAVRLMKGAWKGLHLSVFFVAALAVLHTLGTGVHYVLVARTPLTISATLVLLGCVLWVWRLRQSN